MKRMTLAASVMAALSLTAAASAFAQNVRFQEPFVFGSYDGASDVVELDEFGLVVDGDALFGGPNGPEGLMPNQSAANYTPEGTTLVISIKGVPQPTSK